MEKEDYQLVKVILVDAHNNFSNINLCFLMEDQPINLQFQTKAIPMNNKGRKGLM